MTTLTFAQLDEMGFLERAGEAEALTMVPVGPVAAKFVHDRAYLSTIMGPFGSAKTTTAFQKIINIGMWQNEDSNGVRHSRGCITRPTYGQLQDTVMKDWFEWFPKTRDNWNGEQLSHNLSLEIPGVCKLQIEVLFRACEDRKKAEQIFKGMQLTWLWPNEIDTQSPGVLEFGLPRLGRYPPASKGGCAWYGMFADMNAPDIDNYTYDLLVNGEMGLPPEVVEQMRAELGKDFRIAFHRQPGGMDPDAENLMNLPKGYYQRLMIGKSDNWKRRFIDNEFGAVRNGQPVYPEYNDDFHCAKEPLKPTPGVPVSIGVDAGSTPAIVFGQRLDNGQIRTLKELVIYAPDEDAVLEKFAPEVFGEMAAEFWLEHFGRSTFGGGWYDPAAQDGDEYQDSWARIFWAAFRTRIGPAARGWKFKAAPVRGNRLPERHKAVRDGLVNNCSGQPGQLISPECKVLRRGFNNGYVLRRVQSSSGGSWALKPVKSDESHVHDAKQYLDLGLTKRGAMADGGEPRASAARSGGKVDYGKGYFAHRARS
jgi:hypothetical protein